MKTTHRLFITIAATVALLITCHTYAEDKQMPSSQSETSAIAHMPIQKNQCFGKGGLGLVGKRVYVVLNSLKNELKLPDGKDWIGQSTSEKECVFVLHGKVFPANQLPKDFKLEDSLIVSFEGEKVLFFTFGNLVGGFYKR